MRTVLEDKRSLIQKFVLSFILTIWLWVGGLEIGSSTANINVCPEEMVLIRGGRFEMGADNSDVVKEISQENRRKARKPLGFRQEVPTANLFALIFNRDADFNIPFNNIC
ncbi:hypothetical protein IAR63_10490 [Cylindrospermopsis curvispora GIHE-G1]|uniref:Sulfatase-modifying factor enzyme domain-containing protein n=1 Tax=Cylindrospermopsis curvispora GIHE-G1 TaxID=2666332 RepID=A0A7H0EX41_9CYAN|nr:hypothetical protein IAR63_10490 [Cylindrospermopsis curvispora GIHE-G1]